MTANDDIADVPKPCDVGMGEREQDMTSAHNETPPSRTKLDLIRRFLRAAGIQARIDNASFLDRFAMMGGAVFTAACVQGTTIGEASQRSISALKKAYENRQHIWQEEYESHVNWEFTQTELEMLVTFLEAPVGQHFLEGCWRMDAYVGTNTEGLIEQIVSEATMTVTANPN